MPYPTIDEQPALGLTESVEAATGQAVVDVREPQRGLPLLTPEENLPADDAHRVNHALKRIGSDLAAIRLASIVGLDAHLLMGEPLA